VPKDRAEYWMTVAIMLSAGFIVSQTPAIMVAAMVGVAIAMVFDRITFG
jgi:hypothetical protein